MVNPIEFVYYFVVAAGVGALVGMEREHHRGDDVVVAGIRTFPLVSLFGFLLAYLGANASSIGADAGSLGALAAIGLPIVGALAVGLLVVRYLIGAPGLTTPFALLLTYISGMLVGYGLLFEAIVVSVATTFLLVSKRRLHRFASILDDAELISALEFITIAFVLYPLTLQLAFPPQFDILNQGRALDVSNLFLIVVFVSSISFVSFLLIRSKGAALGMKVSGLLGGLVSSEAATISLSNLAKKNRDLVPMAVAGIVMANATMFVRDLAVCAFSDPSFATATILALPMIVLSAFGFAMGLTVKTKPVSEKLEIESPFSVGAALRFGAIFVAISALDVGLQHVLGSGAVLLIALGGFASSAAVVASVSTLAFVGTIDPWTAAITAVLATAIASANKLLLSRVTCKDVAKAVQTRVVIMTVAAFAVTALMFILRT